MQSTEMVWTTLVEDHPGIISAKFGQNPISSFREEVVWIKKVNTRLFDEGQRPDTIAHFEDFVLTWAKNVDGGRTKTGHNSSSWALWTLVS